jgi:hypothetical protein
MSFSRTHSPSASTCQKAGMTRPSSCGSKYLQKRMNKTMQQREQKKERKKQKEIKRERSNTHQPVAPWVVPSHAYMVSWSSSYISLASGGGSPGTDSEARSIGVTGGTGGLAPWFRFTPAGEEKSG